MSKNKTSTTKITNSKKTTATQTSKTAINKALSNAAKTENSKKQETSNNKCYFNKSLQFIGLILVIIAVNFLSSQYIFKKDNVNEKIAKWISSNPKAILESVINMQKEQAETQQQDMQKNISTRIDDLYNRKDSPVKTSSNTDVTIIEFFDYNCGYCKKALGSIEKVINTDKKVKIIFKELPILGQSSEELAKIALAFNIIAPSKYFDFHSALMKSNARTADAAIKIAETKGIARAKINRILKKFEAKIKAEIDLNRELSAQIGIRGTPAFLVGEQLFPGAVGFETLQQAIKQERQNN